VRSTLPDTERVVVALCRVGRCRHGSPSWCRGPVARPALRSPKVRPVSERCRRRAQPSGSEGVPVVLWIVFMVVLAVVLVATFLAVRARPGASGRRPPER
jgi:hypothetical protein